MLTDAGWVTERLTVDGNLIHCRRSTGGSGVPVVHVHGFAISGEYLMPTARRLAGQWTTLFRTCPGTGAASASTAS